MSALRRLLDRIGKPFHPGGKLQRFFPLYEAADTFFYAPATTPQTENLSKPGMIQPNNSRCVASASTLTCWW